MTDFIAEDARAPLPFTELRTSGLLWLINRVVFHPRGFALGLHHDHAGNPYGWSLLGDGTEVWAFESDEDTKFEAAQAFLRQHTKPLDDEPPSPPDTGKLCCCHTGQDCPACLTGRCWECPDNPERERDEDRGDDEDEEWGEDD